MCMLVRGKCPSCRLVYTCAQLALSCVHAATPAQFHARASALACSSKLDPCLRAATPAQFHTRASALARSSKVDACVRACLLALLRMRTCTNVASRIRGRPAHTYAHAHAHTHIRTSAHAHSQPLHGPPGHSSRRTSLHLLSKPAPDTPCACRQPLGRPARPAPALPPPEPASGRCGAEAHPACAPAV